MCVAVTIVLLGPNLLWQMFVRLNDRLARLATPDPLTGGDSLHYTVSIGVSPAIAARSTQHAARSSWQSALRDADAALCRAKHTGCNQVVAAAPSPRPTQQG